MSGLPILSPINPAQLSARDVSGAMSMQPSQSTTTAVRTITASAVHQIANSDQTDKTARKVLATGFDKRSRLVGPPPTFEVNLLQHMRETRMDREFDSPLDETSDVAEEPAFQAESEPQMPVSAYENYAKITGDSGNSDRSEVDKSV